jgi:hypothetical protein
MTCIVLAGTGLLEGLGGNLLFVALCMALSAPPLVGRCCRWLDPAPPASTAQLRAALGAAAWASPEYVPVDLGVPAGSAGQLRLLTDEELCERWRTSCAALLEHGSPLAGGEVEYRRELLDELERRNPAGFLT